MHTQSSQVEQRQHKSNMHNNAHTTHADMERINKYPRSLQKGHTRIGRRVVHLSDLQCNTGYATVTAMQMIQHLYDNYGRIKQHDLLTNDNNMKE